MESTKKAAWKSGAVRGVLPERLQRTLTMFLL